MCVKNSKPAADDQGRKSINLLTYIGDDFSIFRENYWTKVDENEYKWYRFVTVTDLVTDAVTGADR